MSTIKTLYPVTSSVAVTISLGGLANDSNNMLAGQSSAYIDNSANLDLDHLVSGYIKLGTSPVAAQSIEVWAYAPLMVVSGTSTFPDSVSGANSAKTMSSLNIKFSGLRLVATMICDAVTGSVVPFAPVSIAGLFGSLPVAWGLFVVNGSGVALDASSSNHAIHYQRQQAQTV